MSSEKITAENFKSKVESFDFDEKEAKQKEEALSTITDKASQYKNIALQMMYLSGRYFDEDTVENPRDYKPTNEDIQKWLKFYGGEKYLSKIILFGKKNKVQDFTKEKIKFNKKEVDKDLLAKYPNLYDKASFNEAFDTAQYQNKEAGTYYDVLKDISIESLTNDGLNVVNSQVAKEQKNMIDQWKKSILARKELSKEEQNKKSWNSIKKFTEFVKDSDSYKIGNGKADIVPSGANFHDITNAEYVAVTEGSGSKTNMYEIKWNEAKNAYYYNTDIDAKKSGKFYLKNGGSYILFPVPSFDEEEDSLPESDADSNPKIKVKTAEETIDTYFKKKDEKDKENEKK